MAPAWLRRRPEILARRVAGEAVLLDPRDGGVHLLNSTALVLWERLALPCREAELVQALDSSFEIGPGADPAGDVGRLLAELLARDLVVGEGG